MKWRNLLMIFSIVTLVLLAACTPVATSGGDTASDGDASTGEAAMAGGPCSEVEVGESAGMPDLQGCTLRIAVENAYQPFNFIDTDSGEGVGYDYDIFNEICTRINCTPEFVETSGDAMVAVMGGQGDFDTFDVGADGITITEERAQNVDFSMPYIRSAQVLLVGIDEDRFTEPAEFAADPNLLIGTQLGTTNYDAAANLVGEDRVTAFDQFGAAVQALINGDVDAVMIDNVAGQGYVGANADKLKITGEAVESEELGFIYGKGSPLVAPIDTALQSMVDDGTLEEYFNKWFNTEE
ncbi:MAG: transporter substrate-binding domain-containing protein [Caldilineaceae bacterium]